MQKCHCSIVQNVRREILVPIKKEIRRVILIGNSIVLAGALIPSSVVVLDRVGGSTWQDIRTQHQSATFMDKL